MSKPSFLQLTSLASLIAVSFATQAAEQLPPVQITASRTPQDALQTPDSITIITAEELAQRNATDLRSALRMVAGVDVGPASDGGPSAAAVSMWGLSEVDSYLLLVDGIPWGGAFNPNTAALDLNNVERIEVLRGPAPVLYGATSFNGVINVIHYAAGKAPAQAALAFGSHRYGSASTSYSFEPAGPLAQSLALDTQSQHFSQDRSSSDKSHVLYRAAADIGDGKAHLDLDLVHLTQKPYSPHPLGEGGLSPDFPLDANSNPSDARADQDRAQLKLGYEHNFGAAQWATSLAFAHTSQRNIRGFLRPDFDPTGDTHNADGYDQSVHLNDTYFDSHLVMPLTPQLTWTTGLDWLYGNGRQTSANFEYGIPASGSNAPPSQSLPVDETTALSDRRNFGGVYTQLAWQPAPEWNVVAGLRYNSTKETRTGMAVDQHAPPGTDPFEESTSHSERRFSGSLGASYALWKEPGTQMDVFANATSAFKPAALDFGPEAEGEILKPETAKSWQIGTKGRALGGMLDWELAYFHMNFSNLVVATSVDGLPALANAGKERFKGVELEGTLRLDDRWSLLGSWAYHDARYADYQSFDDDGNPAQFAGNRLEMSPRNLLSFGLAYADASGLNASASLKYIGNRYLNPDNDVLAGAYTTLDAGIGYRFKGWGLRLDGVNLTDRRDPVAVSELGSGAAPRRPGRLVMLGAQIDLK